MGYAMGERMTRDLVSQSLLRAVATKRPFAGLIHHSDRGSQYCAKEYASLLNWFGMVASMSRKGNCYDNALMESFWGVLKNEQIHHYRYATMREAISDVTECIGVSYNRQRLQAKLGYLSPVAYEQLLYEKRLAARNIWCPLLTTNLMPYPFQFNSEENVDVEVFRRCDHR